MSMRGNASANHPSISSATSILAGNASDMSCSCAFNRPSNDTAISTITSSAVTGSASRTPIREEIGRSANQRLCGNSAENIRARRYLFHAEREEPYHLAMKPQGEEQQTGDQLRQHDQHRGIGLAVWVHRRGEPVARRHAQHLRAKAEPFERDGDAHPNGDSQGSIPPRPTRRGCAPETSVACTTGQSA